MENLKLDANEYLPLRDVVFKILEGGYFKRRSKTRRAVDGIAVSSKTRGEPYTDP